MSNNRQRSRAIRAHMAENPGVSHTAATFALKAEREAPVAAPARPAKPERPDVSHLYGHLVIAKAPRRRTRNGLLLPPKPGSRSKFPRLHTDGDAEPTGFDPAGYDLTPLFGSWALSNTHHDRAVYHYGDLPSTQLLATKTVLHDEMRRKPADPDQPLAYFYSQSAKAHFALYATADSIALPELPPKRQAAWDAARTCATCGKSNPTPFPNQLSATNRYCKDCWPTARADDFAARQRPIQLQQVEWAEKVLSDPNVILVGNESTLLERGARLIGLNRTRIETIDGAVLLDVLVAAPAYSEFDLDSPDERAIFETLTPREERRRAVEALRGRRLVVFDSARSYFLDDGESRFPIAEHDHVAARYECWFGHTRAYNGQPHRPAPTIDLAWPGNFRDHPFTHRRWEERDAAGKIELTRECLRTIATEPPGPAHT